MLASFSAVAKLTAQEHKQSKSKSRHATDEYESWC